MAKKRKKLTKKQISFILSVMLVGVGGLYVFLSDVIDAFQDSPPQIVDSQTQEALGQGAEAFGDAINTFGETLGAGDSHSNGSSFETNISNLDRAEDTGTVIRVVDGDTFCVDIESVKGDEEKGTKIRIIGVDTPESVAPSTYYKDNTKEGATVKDIVKSEIKEGDTLLIEYDVQKNDKYGRTLAYLYFPDGTMVEEWLLNNGYANVATYPPNVKYADHFQELAHKAAVNKIGLWNGFFEETTTESPK